MALDVDDPVVIRGVIWNRIVKERRAQDVQWDGNHEWGFGSCASPGVEDIVKATVLTEETGEVARAVLEGRGLQRELVQVAAVAVAWLECLEREGT